MANKLVVNRTTFQRWGDIIDPPLAYGVVIYDSYMKEYDDTFTEEQLENMDDGELIEAIYRNGGHEVKDAIDHAYTQLQGIEIDGVNYDADWLRKHTYHI